MTRGASGRTVCWHICVDDHSTFHTAILRSYAFTTTHQPCVALLWLRSTSLSARSARSRTQAVRSLQIVETSSRTRIVLGGVMASRP